VPVVPAYIDGLFDALPKGAKSFKRHPVSVYIGEPINFNTAYFDRNNKEVYQRMSEEIMKHIAELKKAYADKTG
jgi:1-acyl-sn-glycerol-3-phosphate acyltransferase